MVRWLVLYTCMLALPMAAVAQELPRSAADLVRDLGDPSYAVREKAYRELRLRGKGALPALEQGLNGDQPEIRQRCLMLLRSAGRSELRLKLDAFILDESAIQEPLPGWLKFKELGGSTPDTRGQFALLYSEEAELVAQLDKLQKNPKAIEQMLRDRLQKAVRQQNRAEDAGSKPGEFLACTWIALQLPTIPQEQFHLFHEMCYHQQQHSAILADPLLKKLLSKLLRRQSLSLTDGTLDMVVRMATYMSLTELIEDKLKSSIKSAIEQGTKDAVSKTPGQLNQLAHLARELKQVDLIESHLRPAARRVAEAFAAIPFDPNRFHEVFWLVQTLEMSDTREHVLKPAALRHALSAAELEGSESVFFQACNCLQQFGVDEALKKLLQPAARQVLSRFGANTDQLNQFHQAIQISRVFAIEECLERDLKPALKKIGNTILTQPNQTHNLQQLVNLAQQLGAKDVLEEMVVPHVRKQLHEWDKKPHQLAEFHQIFQLARRLDRAQEFDPLLKPLARKAVEDYRKNWRGNPGFIYIAFDLVGQTDLIAEGTELALDVSLDKSQNQAWYTFQALQHLAKHGTKEHFLKLEPLLENKQVVTSYGLNNRVYNLQTRDLALQLLLRAHGETIADYGFQAGMLPHAVLEDKDRETALKKYREKFAKK